MLLRIGVFILAAALTAGCQALHVEPEGGGVPAEHLLSGAAVFGEPVSSGDAPDVALIQRPKIR